jgi:drug/metabolite transporter (DMT)-like permease
MVRQFQWLTPSLSLLIACALWGAGTVISKELLGSVPPVLFLIIQLAPSAAILWLITWHRNVSLPRGRTLLAVIALGWLNPGVSYTLSMLGLVHTTASVATLMWAAEPALIIALAWVVLRENITLAMIALTATAAVGVTFASGIAAQGFSLEGQAYGAILILLGVLCCAIYTVAARGIAAGLDPLAVIAIQQSVALAWVLAIWPTEWRGSAMDELSQLSGAELVGGLISGLMYYALAFWFYLNGLRSMPASRAGNFFNLIPVFGVTLAYVFLGERMSAAQWAGAALILASVASLQVLAADSRNIQASGPKLE